MVSRYLEDDAVTAFTCGEGLSPPRLSSYQSLEHYLLDVLCCPSLSHGSFRTNESHPPVQNRACDVNRTRLLNSTAVVISTLLYAVAGSFNVVTMTVKRLQIVEFICPTLLFRKDMVNLNQRVSCKHQSTFWASTFIPFKKSGDSIR